MNVSPGEWNEHLKRQRERSERVGAWMEQTANAQQDATRKANAQEKAYRKAKRVEEEVKKHGQEKAKQRKK